ncbi:signal recognition particle receptor beta subunit-domain-containing protein [Rhodocollybia butyracea]|uniref:Signal recognition particle receptor subunit beta n=1 Tax=Rhodocollybia butyracea TaxID=206335 RepID=A0A9P5PWC0_9AGAR|nr:signal recognition particle receptor beta subunit-domain-containing protein [Rhodocollybia butyracea]
MTLSPSPQLLLSSLLLALTSIAIFFFISRRKNQAQRNVLLLTGPSDSGKTAIFSSLIHGHAIPTNTSMQVNSSFITTTQVVDVPGHPRLRDQFKEFLPLAKAVVFVVDANTVSRNAAVAAEHLHSILDAIMAIPPSQPLPTLLILAHKADLIKASSISADTTTLAITRVQTILERELERRRHSGGGVGVESLGEDSEKSSGLDCHGPSGTFKFDNWEGGDVVFLATSVKTSIAPLTEWVEENM